MKCDQSSNARTLQPVSPHIGKPEIPEMISEDSDDEAYEHRAEGEIGAIDDEDEAEDWDDHDLTGPTPKVLRDVKTPSAKDIEEHNTTHIPAKAWCPWCVAGKMPNPAHRKIDEYERAVPEIGIDYAFMKEKGNDETLTIIVMKDRDTKAISSDVVELKGRGIDGTIERVIENIRRLGYKKIILKSDQEPALVDLINGIIEARDDITIPECSPVGESQSNGMIERAVRSVKDQVRTLRLALQGRIRRRVPQDRAVMTWLVQHSGDTITKHQAGVDGKTAYERIMGKPGHEETLEFGEIVNFKLDTDDLGDLDARWASGVWLGKRWKSIEHLVHTNGEVIKCRAVSRKPLEERWSADAIESIVATPWNHRPSANEGVREARVLPPLPKEEQVDSQPQPREPDVRAPLRPRITKSDLSRWGYSDGCLRCRQMRSGHAEDGSKHSEQCRKRIESEMRREEDPRIKRAEDKHTHFQEEVMQAKKAIDKRAAKAARTRRGGDGEDIAPVNKKRKR